MKSLTQQMNLKTVLALSILTFSCAATAAEIYSEQQADVVYQVVSENDVSRLHNMIDHGLDVNSQFIGDGTPLIMAVYKNQSEMVRELVAMGADVNLPSKGDGNPLIAAAMKNRLALASYLLQNGAELDAIVPGDETALINASRKGHFDMVQLLVEQGADVNLGMTVETIRGSEYRSPLSMAKTSRIRNYLRDAGATR